MCPPALDQPDVDIEQIEAAADGLVDDVVDGLRVLIERRHRRHDDGAVLGCRQHAAQMAGMQRRLAHHQHEAAALLERHVGGAAQKRVGGAVGDVGQSADRARHDDHAPRAVRARGNRGAEIRVRVARSCQRLHLIDRAADFLLQREPGGLGDDGVRRNIVSLEDFKQPDAVNGAGRPTDADDERKIRVHRAILPRLLSGASSASSTASQTRRRSLCPRPLAGEGRSAFHR